jgi:hypothetical protein
VTLDQAHTEDAVDPVLRLAPDIALRLRGGKVEIEAGDRTHLADMRVLEILTAFTSPKSVGEALARLSSAGSEQLTERRRLVHRLRDKGVLVDEAHDAPRFAYGFGSSWPHVAMLDDVTRTGAFMRALRATVRRGDVVLDIGTGTGIFAIEAVRAGARRVYAVEQRGIRDAAREVFGVNGFSDRIVVVDERSTRVELPEKVDVLVGELLGNDPLAEGVLSTFRDARERHLKPGAQVIPRSVGIFALPVDLPEEYLDAHTFTAGNVARWHEDFGIDFGPLTAFGAGITNLPNVEPQVASRWPAISAPVSLARIDLMRCDPIESTTTTFVAQSSARCLGLLLYFEAELSPGILLSTGPSGAGRDSHWTCCVFRATERSAVSPGDVVSVEFSAGMSQTVLRAR